MIVRSAQVVENAYKAEPSAASRRMTYFLVRTGPHEGSRLGAERYIWRKIYAIVRVLTK